MAAFYDWRAISNMSEEELKEQFSDLELNIIKRHQLIMFLYYTNSLDRAGFAGVTSAEIDAWVYDERAKLVQKYGEDVVTNLETSYVSSLYDREEIEGITDNVVDLFKNNGLAKKEYDELKRLADDKKMSEEDLAMLSLAAAYDPEATGDIDRKEGESREDCAKRNYEQMTSKILHPKEQWDPKKLGHKRDESMRRAKKLLEDQKKGIPQTMAKTMRGSLLHQLGLFCDARDCKEAAKNAEILRETMKFVEENPDVFKCCDFKQNELDALYGAMELGKTIIRGNEAVEKMSYAAMNNIELTEDQKKDYMADVFQMQVALSDKEKQIELYNDSLDKGEVQKSDRMKPTQLQMKLGKGITAKEIKAGKQSPESLKMRKSMKMSEFFNRMAKKDTVQLTQTMFNKDKRKSLTGALINEITNGKLMDKMVGANKELEKKGLVKKEPGKNGLEKEAENNKPEKKNNEVKPPIKKSDDVKQLKPLTNERVLEGPSLKK